MSNEKDLRKIITALYCSGMARCYNPLRLVHPYAPQVSRGTPRNRNMHTTISYRVRSRLSHLRLQEEKPLLGGVSCKT